MKTWIKFCTGCNLLKTSYNQNVHALNELVLQFSFAQQKRTESSHFQARAAVATVFFATKRICVCNTKLRHGFSCLCIQKGGRWDNRNVFTQFLCFPTTTHFCEQLESVVVLQTDMSRFGPEFIRRRLLFRCGSLWADLRVEVTRSAQETLFWSIALSSLRLRCGVNLLFLEH